MESHLQFSLRALMLAIVAVAVLITFVTLPLTIANYIVLLLSFFVPPLLVVGLVHGKRSVQAFCIGAFLPSFILAVGSGGAIAHSAVVYRNLNFFSAFDWLARRPFVRDQFLMVFAVALVVGTACLLLQRAMTRTRIPWNRTLLAAPTARELLASC